MARWSEERRWAGTSPPHSFFFQASKFQQGPMDTATNEGSLALTLPPCLGLIIIVKEPYLPQHSVPIKNQLSLHFQLSRLLDSGSSLVVLGEDAFPANHSPQRPLLYLEIKGRDKGPGSTSGGFQMERTPLVQHCPPPSPPAEHNTGSRC